VVSIAPLAKFQISSFDTLVNVVGKTPLTRAITDLIMGMISWDEEVNQQKLLSIIDLCKNQNFEEVAYLVSNITLLLLEYKHDFFKDGELSNLCLYGFKLPMSDYHPENLDNRKLGFDQKTIQISGTNFQNSDLRKVNFGASSLDDITFKNTNFRNAMLDDFEFQTVQLDEITLIESNRLVALASPQELRLLDIDTFKIEKKIFDKDYVWHVSISPDEKYLFQAKRDGFKIRDLKSLDSIYQHTLSQQSNSNASEPNSRWTESFAFVPTSNLLFVGRANSFIHLINLNEKREINAVNSFTSGISKLSVSPCERFFVSSGFHEFILWDIKTFQKLVCEQVLNSEEPQNIEQLINSDYLKKYTAQFHPIKSQFVVLDGNRVRFFDTALMNFYDEINLGGGDFLSRLDCMAFSQDGVRLFVASQQAIYVIDYHQKSLIRTIQFSNDQFPLPIQEPNPRPGIEDITVDSKGQTLYVIHNNRCVTKVNVNTGEILDIYWHLCDFTGADFTGAKGLTKPVLDQLNKNGAIV
jgi:WD40 repeat protein